MSSLSNGLTFQVQLQAPRNSNVTAIKRQIQAGLGNIQANIQLKNAVSANKQINSITNSTKEATKATRTFGEAIGIAGRNFVAYTSAVAIVGRLSVALSRATRDAIKFEREFVKLAQVLDTNVGNLKGLNREISGLSREFGISANVIAKTSVILAQSGLNANEVAKALRTLSKTTLASTFQNIGQTTEGAIAIIAQFGQGAGALEKQLSQVNAVTKDYATESADLIEAVRRGGAAFVAAGGNFEEFISLFTAVRSTTRESAETIATGFRTIFARLQRPKTIQYFKDLGIELEDSTGKFIGAFQAVEKISEGLEKLNIRPGQTAFAEVVEQVGGIRQVSRVIPLLTQFKKAEEARQVAIAGGRSLDVDVAKAQETTAQAIERTRQNFVALIREISETSSFKTLLNFTLALANAFTEIARTLKPLIPIIGTLATIKLGGILAGAARTGFGASTIGSRRPFANGGPVLGFNRGGSVPGTGNGDTVPAMLEPGEFVIRKSAVQAFGEGGLADINKYASGGVAKLANKRSTIKNFYNVGEGGVNDSFNVNPKRIEIADRKTLRFQAGEIWNKASSINTENGKIAANSFIKNSTGGFAGVGSQTLGRKELREGNRDEQRLNKITGALAENIVQAKLKKTGQKVTKLPDSRGPDFLVGNKYAEVKTNQDRVSDNELIVKAVLGKGIAEKGALKRNNKEDTVKPLIDFYFAKFAKGGSVGTDTVPALLTPGEFVINKKSAQAFGYGGLAKINKYAKGGPVQKFQNGGTAVATSGFDPKNVTNALLGLSVGLSALTAISSDASKEMQAVTDGMADFGLVLISILTAASFSGKKATALKEVIGGKNKEDDPSEQLEEVAKDIDKSGKALNGEFKTMISQLKRLNRTLNAALSDRQRQSLLTNRARTRSNINLIRRQGPGGELSGSRGITLPNTAQRKFGQSVEKSTSLMSKFGGGLNVANTALTLVAAAAAGASSLFTIMSRNAEIASEKAVKEGNIREALAKAEEARVNKAKANAIKIGVGGGAALGAGIGAIFGPLGIAIGSAVGALTGLAASLGLAEKFMGLFIRTGFKMVSLFNDIIKDLGLGDFSTEITSAFASISPEVTRTTKRLDVLGRAFQAATDIFLKAANRDLEAAQVRVRQASDQEGKRGPISDIVKINEDLLNSSRDLQREKEREIRATREELEEKKKIVSQPLGRPERRVFDGAAGGRFGRVVPGTEGQTQAERDLTLKELAKSEEQLKKFNEELKETIKSQAQSSLKIIGSATDLARGNRTASETYRELNNGQRIAIDQGGIIQADNLANNSQLKRTYDLLRKSGLNQAQAQAKLTEAVFGSTSAVQDFTKATESSVKLVGSKLQTLLFGGVEDKLKSARTIQNAAAVAGGASLSGIQDAQGRQDVINFSASAYNAGIKTIGGQDIREGLKSNVPQSVLDQFTAGLEGDEKTAAENALVDAIFGLDSTAVDQLDATKQNILAIRANTLAIESQIEESTTVVNGRPVLINEHSNAPAPNVRGPLPAPRPVPAPLRRNALPEVPSLLSPEAVGQTEGGPELQQGANTLLEAARTIPTEIAMNVGGETINVNINGAEILNTLMPGVQSLVIKSIVNELIDFEQTQSSSGPGSYTTKKTAEKFGGTP